MENDINTETLMIVDKLYKNGNENETKTVQKLKL
jgi:hypothetical protein